MTTPTLPEIQQGATFIPPLVQAPVPESWSWSMQVSWPTTPPAQEWNFVQPSQDYPGPGQPALQPKTDLGRWTVNSNAILHLPVAGDYYFKSLTLEPNAAIDIPVVGNVRIFVLENLTYRGNIRRCTTCTAPVPSNPFTAPAQPPDVEHTLVVVLGTQQIPIERRLYLHLIAPNAAVNVDGGNFHSGSIFAKSVEIHQYQRLKHYPLSLNLLAGLGSQTPNMSKVTPSPNPPSSKDGMEAESVIGV